MTTKHVCTRWVFDLSSWTPTLPQLAQAVVAVQPEERARLMKFHFIDDFLSSLVGRLLMRKYVSTCSGLPYHEVQFGRDGRGKPYWLLDGVRASEAVEARLPQLSFNVSHHGDFVVLAGVAAANGPEAVDFGVGVDVMKIEYPGNKGLSEFFRIMHRKFSESEWRYIRRPQHNQSDQLKAFMRHWCLKEAYVKELGVGITIDLQTISFTVDPLEDLAMECQPLTSTTLCCNNIAMEDWHFEEHMLHPKYCAAIAFRKCKPNKDKFVCLTIGELIRPSAKADDADILEYCRNVLRKQRK